MLQLCDIKGPGLGAGVGSRLPFQNIKDEVAVVLDLEPARAASCGPGGPQSSIARSVKNKIAVGLHQGVVVSIMPGHQPGSSTSTSRPSTSEQARRCLPASSVVALQIS